MFDLFEVRSALDMIWRWLDLQQEQNKNFITIDKHFVEVMWDHEARIAQLEARLAAHEADDRESRYDA